MKRFLLTLAVVFTLQAAYAGTNTTQFSGLLPPSNCWQVGPTGTYYTTAGGTNYTGTASWSFGSDASGNVTKIQGGSTTCSAGTAPFTTDAGTGPSGDRAGTTAGSQSFTITGANAQTFTISWNAAEGVSVNGVFGNRTQTFTSTYTPAGPTPTPTPGAGEVTAHFRGSLTTAARTPHVLSLVVNGSVVLTQQVFATINGSVESFKFSKDITVPEGAKYAWRLDSVGFAGSGTIIGGSGISPDGGLTNNTVQHFWADPIQIDIGQDPVIVTPAGQPTPTPWPQATPIPNATPFGGGAPDGFTPKVGGGLVTLPPVPGASPGSIIKVGGGGVSGAGGTSGNDGNVTVSNSADIYKPITESLESNIGTFGGGGIAGANDAQSNMPTGATQELPTGPSNQDGLKTVGEGLNTKRESLEEQGKTGFTGLPNPITNPPVLGTKCQWNVTLPKLGSFSVNLCQYEAIVIAMRHVCMVVLIIWAYFVTMGTIRESIA